MDDITKNRIKKFKEFLDKSNESFDNIIAVTYNTKDNIIWDGIFSINNIDYFIKIKIIEIGDITKDDKVYICKFGNFENEKKNYKKLKDNDQGLSALGTIRHNLTEFINEIQPNVLTFYGSDSDETRIKLYQHFCEEIINKDPQYFATYHLYLNKIPIFIISKITFNILKIKDFYIQVYEFLMNN